MKTSIYTIIGLKNAFRLEVQRARESLGLDVSDTNAPANQMEEKADIVVNFAYIYL